MNIPIKPRLQDWLNRHQTIKPWLWFIGLWLGGFLAMLTIALPIKFLTYLAAH